MNPFLNQIESEPRRTSPARKGSAHSGRPTGRTLKWMLFLLAGLFLRALTVQAQAPLSNLVVTVGTTIRTNGTDYSYILIGAPQMELLSGKRFAIYGKPGYPTNAASFTRRDTIFQHTDTSTINDLLNQSVVLGENTNELGNALDTLLHSTVANITTKPLPQKVAAAFQIANSDPTTAQVLYLLAHVHPGLDLCFGQAFSEPITTVTTYEVREADPVTGAAGAVVGRVTVVPGSPVVLPAPGEPFQVVTNDPSDHLRIRLRWGTPPELRRLSLLSYGFDIWRISLTNYLALGYDITPPTLPQQLYTNAYVAHVNPAPVMASKLFLTGAGPGSASDMSDSTTYFYSDNNGHALGRVHFPTNTTPPAGYLTPPFHDGDQFFYFITARDVLGRDGFVSPAGYGEACRRIPPQPLTSIQVANNFKVLGSGSTLTNQQCLRVSWNQDFDTNEQVTEYWVYRWPNPAMALQSDSDPTNHLIAVVKQQPGTNVNFYLDNGTNAPLTPGLSNYWYTVRAVSQAACAPLLSPQSPPAWGVLRQRAGPAATTGQVIGSCGTPAVMVQATNMLSDPGSSNVFKVNYRFTCQRRDPGIAWVEFFPSNQLGVVDSLGPLYFAPDGDSLNADYSVTISGSNELAGVRCVVGTSYGEVSQAATAIFPSSPLPGQREEAAFYAGQMLLTALHSNDPLLPALNRGQTQTGCQSPYAAAANNDGMVEMLFDVLPGTPMLIQVSTNQNATLALWSDVGVITPDTNNIYWMYYPDCRLGPLPPIQGCPVNLTSEGGCDQHISRAEPGGPVAPIHVRFRLTPRTHEYRVYRRVDDGPFTMIAQGAAVYDPNNPNKIIDRKDDAMPPSAARLCYFVQLLDRNGNGSPMALIGCKESNPSEFPTPIMSAPQDAGTTNFPAVALNWFCPTSGVSRFQLNIERADQPNSAQPSGISSSNLTKVGNINLNARYYGLYQDQSVPAQFNDAGLTPPISAGFGPGPKFTLTASVLPNVPYHISVAAVDNEGKHHNFSKIWTFVWKPPTVLPSVPWPARPLPPVSSFDEVHSSFLLFRPFWPRVQAILLRDREGLLDDRYPVGIRIGGPLEYGQGSIYSYAQVTENVGNTENTNFAGYSVIATPTGIAGFPPPPADPHTLIFKRESTDPTRNGQSLLPIVVYRMQMTNSLFKRVSGALTQVTPMLERIPYSLTTDTTNGTTTVTIYDRLLAIGYETDSLFQTTKLFLYLRDQQPVILGASYEYFVARFNEQHEISEIIPAGTVTIPLNP